MKTNTLTINKRSACLLALILSVIANGCTDFVKIDPPQTDLIKSTVFTDDNTALAAVIDIYYYLSQSGFASGDANSMSLLCSLSSDELIDYTSGGGEVVTIPFNQNVLTSQNLAVATFWSQPYTAIYKANSIIEGLQTSVGVSAPAKLQLEGEAKFIRAFCHFYLVNMFGDVPLILSTNYQANNQSSRTPADQVYKQIITDLLDAQTAVSDDYQSSDGERTRVNKGAVTALLARVYLYTEDWKNAEIQAGSVIDNSDTYMLEPDLNSVFFSSSTEAIWQFENIYYPNDLGTFYVYDYPQNAALRKEFIAAFEPGDKRRSSWVDTVSSGSDTIYFPTKYKSLVPMQEYSTVLRLAETILVRAEARTYQNEFADAISDVNMIRARSNLTPTTANDLTTILAAIEQERKVELFTEQGHRWFDLKRTKRVDAVLSKIKPEWKPAAALYPIPDQQIQNDPAMRNSQNPGY